MKKEEREVFKLTYSEMTDKTFNGLRIVEDVTLSLRV